jgi:hypothetical protein
LWCPECWHEHTALLDRPQAACLSLVVEEGFATVLETFERLGGIPTIEPGNRGRHTTG